jgi:hypothetical protein
MLIKGNNIIESESLLISENKSASDKRDGIENISPEVFQLEDMKKVRALNIVNEKVGLYNFNNFLTTIKEFIYYK